MENNKKSLAQIWYEAEEKSDEMAINTLRKIYFDTEIKPYLENEKIIDLHTHTKYSDGELSPNALIKLAYLMNIGVIAITDHDTIEAFNHIDYNMPELNYIKLITGIELSAKVSKGTMHILGLGIDVHNPELNKTTKELRTNSANRIISILEQIKKDYGIVFDYEDLRNLFTAHHNLGRPDIAKLCIKYGYAHHIQDAFDKYLIPAHDKIRQRNKGLSYEECIALIQKSGGVPILAHPKTLKLPEKELIILIEKMTANGLQGIEVYHSTHTEEEINLYLNIADRYNLLISGGSDYHGPTVKPDIELGTGINNNLMIKKLTLLNKVKR